MSALFDRILTLNLIANTAIFYVAARLCLLPCFHVYDRIRFLFPYSFCIQCDTWE